MANVEGGASHRFAEAEIRRLARSRHQPDVLCFTLAHASKYNHKYKQIQIQIYHSSIFVMDHAVQTYLHKYILCHSFILWLTPPSLGEYTEFSYLISLWVYFFCVYVFNAGWPTLDWGSKALGGQVIGSIREGVRGEWAFHGGLLTPHLGNPSKTTQRAGGGYPKRKFRKKTGIFVSKTLFLALFGPFYFWRFSVKEGRRGTPQLRKAY